MFITTWSRNTCCLFLIFSFHVCLWNLFAPGIVSHKLSKLAPTLKLFTPRHAPVSAQLMGRICFGLGLVLHGPCIFRALFLAIWRFYLGLWNLLLTENASYLSMAVNSVECLLLIHLILYTWVNRPFFLPGIYKFLASCGSGRLGLFFHLPFVFVFY